MPSERSSRAPDRPGGSRSYALRLLACIVFTLVVGACTAKSIRPPGEGSYDRGGAFDPFWCCDPDEPRCACQGQWECVAVAAGERCTQGNPGLPDADGARWRCIYRADEVVCTGQRDEHPQAGGDGAWSCSAEGGGVICRREAEDEDYPDGRGDQVWTCSYQDENRSRVCRGADGGGDRDCDGEERCGDGIDNDCNGQTDCGDPSCSCAAGQEACDGHDNDGDGRIDEDRACGDASEGDTPCAAGAYRICDSYCGVHQLCGADGRWGACIVDEECTGVLDCDEHVDCPRGEFCDFGLCVPGTFNLRPCESDQECDELFGNLGAFVCRADQGVCISDCYHHSDCGPGLICDLGECVEDTYTAGTCG